MQKPSFLLLNACTVHTIILGMYACTYIKQFFILYHMYMHSIHSIHNYIYVCYMLFIKYMYSNCENILCFEIISHINLALLCYKSCV